jgi:hypothetical protein
MKIFLGYCFIIVSIFLSIKDISLKEDHRIKVIKFMYVNEYPLDYGEKMFWDNAEEEHAIMYTNAFDIKGIVQNLPNYKSKTFKDYTYCFLQPKGNKYDTIYSDSSLKEFIIKKNGKKTFYYDKEGKLATDLRYNYSFFRECW